jgi:hypothetical protein
MAGFSHNLESMRNRKARNSSVTNRALLDSRSPASSRRSKRKWKRRIHPNLANGMARSTRQFVPQPLACFGFTRRRIAIELHEERNPVRTRPLNALQPVEQDGLAFDRRVHDLVSCVETLARAKHRIVADVLAAVANRCNRTDVDLPCVRMPKGRTNPVIRQYDRLSAPRTVETAMRHGTDGSCNRAIRLSWLDSN